jgi:hypothetical protein
MIYKKLNDGWYYSYVNVPNLEDVQRLGVAIPIRQQA